MKRVTYPGIVVLLLAGSAVLAGPTAIAQSTAPAADQTSLGAYARKVHKDTNAKVKPKVFDNDNIPRDDKISVVGEAAAEPAPAGAASQNNSADVSSKTAAPAGGKEPAAAATAKPAVTPEEEQAKKQAEWKGWQEKLSAQKNAIDLATRELDVLQKEYELRAAVMYADVGNRLRNQTQWDKEDAEYKQKIADKEKAVEDAKQKLVDMEEEARKAGVPSAMREP